MVELILEVNTVSDLHAFGEIAKIRELPGIAREVIKCGGRVIVRQRIADPKTNLKIFSNQSEVDDWEKRIKEFIDAVADK